MLMWRAAFRRRSGGKIPSKYLCHKIFDTKCKAYKEIWRKELNGQN